MASVMFLVRVCLCSFYVCGDAISGESRIVVMRLLRRQSMAFDHAVPDCRIELKMSHADVWAEEASDTYAVI